jgi:hypothetical protein
MFWPSTTEMKVKSSALQPDHGLVHLTGELIWVAGLVVQKARIGKDAPCSSRLVSVRASRFALSALHRCRTTSCRRRLSGLCGTPNRQYFRASAQWRDTAAEEGVNTVSREEKEHNCEGPSYQAYRAECRTTSCRRRLSGLCGTPNRQYFRAHVGRHCRRQLKRDARPFDGRVDLGRRSRRPEGEDR